MPTKPSIKIMYAQLSKGDPFREQGPELCSIIYKDQRKFVSYCRGYLRQHELAQDIDFYVYLWEDPLEDHLIGVMRLDAYLTTVSKCSPEPFKK